MASLNVKKGDIVMVIAGKDKDKSGTVIACHPSVDKVTVEGINLVRKCKKARRAGEKSGFVDQPSPIDVSNVMPICHECGKPTRVNHKVSEENGKTVKTRICNKCGASLDVKVTKTKATARKAKRATKKADAE